MKRTLVFSCASLAIVGCWAWQNHKQLEDELRGKRRAIADAAAAGISPEAAQAGNPHHRTRSALRQKNDEVKNLSGKIRALGQAGNDPLSLLDPESEFYQSKEEIQDTIVALGPSQLTDFIDELLAENPMGKSGKEMIKSAILTLTQTDPQRSSLYIVENWERLKGLEGMDNSLAYAFQIWSASDPAEVGGWIRLNRDKIREMAGNFLKYSILQGVAQSEPGRAFALISELQPSNPSNAISAIIGNNYYTTKTKDLRDKRFKAWRGYLSKLPVADGEKLARSTAANFAGWVSFEGFEKGTQWLGGAGFSQDELVEIAGKLNLKQINKEPGPWIDWIGSRLPADKATAPIQSLVREWTAADYQAAGKWLTATPDGPTKNAAIRTYAETVAKADPEVAKQWALTLPPGPEREETLQQIQTK